ncbi:hypothetical protein C5167_045975 [Papaver somniferum]|uniref:FAR1 domain-containing protein n=1 Tax=Papaver somniferum TaxID=3469 RepID=A0A4Y7LEX5_PAPSO|nr:hypothetical protein C5167_045975 [Papaver somniferum]
MGRPVTFSICFHFLLPPTYSLPWFHPPSLLQTKMDNMVEANGKTNYNGKSSEDSKPLVGMEFASIEDVKEFYKAYGRNNGSMTRKRSSYATKKGEGVSRVVFVCSNEGIHNKDFDPDEEGNYRKKRNTSTMRTDCKAMICIAFDGRFQSVIKDDKAGIEAMRISHYCRVSTELAYMFGKSEQAYAVAMDFHNQAMEKIKETDILELRKEHGKDMQVEESEVNDELLATGRNPGTGKGNAPSDSRFKSGTEISKEGKKPRMCKYCTLTGHDSRNCEKKKADQLRAKTQMELLWLHQIAYKK